VDPLETLLRPVATILNRNIQDTTPARELCEQLDDKIVAVRVRDTALTMYFEINDTVVSLTTNPVAEPDVVVTGSLLTLARMAGSSGESAVRDGSLELTGDPETAHAFQQLLAFAKPDIEEELSALIGDAGAHRAGEIMRGVGSWAKGARRTLGANIREYLQEESGDLPSRHEVERFAQQVSSLRDDVARLEARLNKFDNGT
jgi:ubiquinone biosynthesis accessory factor UbiJ